MAYKIVNRHTEEQKEYQCIVSYLRNDPVEKRGKLKPINKMASSVFDPEIERFIKANTWSLQGVHNYGGRACDQEPGYIEEQGC